MTKHETAQLLNTISGLYPRYFKECSKSALDAWHEALEDIDFHDARNAVMSHSRDDKYPPTVADIRERATPWQSRIPNLPNIGEDE